tara:strand:- start:28 stop:201 length:174 start_codon:yes stop_codon:yes gene_type:complete
MLTYHKAELQKRLDKLGFGNNAIVGFFVGDKFATMKLSGGFIIRLEIDTNKHEIIQS